jgi:hypothetical protein
MELIHYSEQPFVYDPTRIYDPEEPHGYGKPVGLWVSVVGPDDWPAWCEAEDFRTHALAHAVRIILRPDTTVLHLQSGQDLDKFHQIYSVETEFAARARAWASPEFIRNQWPIDWARVAEDYQGLIIAPYHWSHRFCGPSWYYGFDCASGCIWDLGAIASVEGIEVCPDCQEKAQA